MKQLEKYDVVIPLKSTNILVIENINKIAAFEEVQFIYIGNSGVAYEVISSLSEIPKVQIVDQAKFYSQGACIVDLVKRVETEFFVYLHADVVLPDDWFMVMRDNIAGAMFAECARKYVYEIQHESVDFSRVFPRSRPLSGSQMGRTQFFLEATSGVGDDYLFRNEDLVFASLVERHGGHYKIINDTYHVHQIGFQRKNENKRLNIKLQYVNLPTIHDLQLFRCQVKGILKYTSPNRSYLIDNLNYSIAVLKSLGDVEFIKEILANKEYRRWHLTIRLHKLYLLKIRILRLLKVAITSDMDIYHGNF